VSVILSVLLWLAAVLGLLLLALLVVPLQARGEGRVLEEELDGELRVRWGFGLIGVRLSSRRPSGFTLCGLRVAGLPRRSAEERQEKKREKKQERAKKQGSRSRRGLRWSLAHREGLRRVLRRALGALGLRLEVRGRLGLGDPAETALAELIAGELRRLRAVRLELAWDYLDDVVELEARGRARLWLLEVVGIGLALLLADREVRALLRAPA